MDDLDLHRQAILVAVGYVARGEKTPQAAADGLRQLGIPCQAADVRSLVEAQMAREQLAREAATKEQHARDWDHRYRSLVELLLEAIPEEALQ